MATTRVQGVAPDGGDDFRINSDGAVLFGTTTNSSSYQVVVNKQSSTNIVELRQGNTYVASFNMFSTIGTGQNGAATVLFLTRDGTTSRSINAAGTVNASGADYAEYMVKADGVGAIAKGDVCGIDSDGKLTDVFSDSVSFVTKSTNPSYVGGDTWASSVGDRPVRGEGETQTAYDARVSTWETDMETARQAVDRIAFAGQVPCNTTGSVSVGDYIVPQDDGSDGIEAVAVSSPTFEQYRSSVGRVIKIEDGTPVIIVKTV